ncbi:MAG: glutamine-hydrolyzing GMP synthase [Candidatus Babeliales bacterium]
MKRYYLVLFFFLSSAQSTILLLDFGCSATHYIRQHIERAHVRCVVRDYHITDAEILAINPQGVVLSGSPFSVYNTESPHVPQIVFDLQIPIFGICYGEQLLAHQLGGRVEHMGFRERGPIEVTVIDTCMLTQGIWHIGDVVTVWMSHEDRVIEVPPGFKTIAYTESSPYAVIAHENRQYYGVQFHPEVPKNGWPQLIEQFVLSIALEEPDYDLVPLRDHDLGALRNLMCSCCADLP